jgi:translation initiation factor IF-2
MEGLVYDPEVRATGVILESQKDKKRGLTVSVILKDGVLKIGDQIATPTAKGKIKILENFLGEKVDSLAPSSPAVIIGFESLPKIGEEFVSGDLTKEEIEKVAVKNSCPDLRKKFCKIDGDCVVKIILKADVSGSLEALSELIHKVPKKETYQLEIISEGVGEISDGDVKSAIATDAIVLGFKVGLNKAAENMAKDNKVRVITSEIIYELIDAIENYFKCLSSGDMTGDLEILAVFGKKAGKQIVGGRVVTGEIKNNAILEVHEAGKSIGSCKVVNLQEGKIDAASVVAGKECGLLVSCEIEIKPQHHLIMR